MELEEILADIKEAIVAIDGSAQPFRAFQPGVGPYGEPQLVKLVANELNKSAKYRNSARTMRTPDLLIPNEWALEIKIARPFGDNGKEAENWSVNLLHPYAGNISTIGDCFKLQNYSGPERRAVVVIGYEHVPARIDLTPLVKCFELIAKQVMGINLSQLAECRHACLIHPVHTCVRLFGWELLDHPRI